MEDRRFAVAFLALLFLPSATAASHAEADFVHVGPSSLTGHVVGSCTAQGLILPVLPVEFETGGGHLEQRLTIVNRTRSPVVETERAERQSVQVFDIGPGKVRLGPTAAGLILGFAAGFPSSSASTFDATWAATRTDRTALVHSDVFPGQHLWVGHPEGVARRPIHVPGDTTRVYNEGTSEAQGSLTLYIREAAILSASGQWPAQPYEQVAEDVVTPALKHRSTEVRDALLTLHDVRWTLPTRTVLACGPSRIHVDGDFFLTNATGELRRDGQEVSFVDRALNLQGAFEVNEEVEERGRARVHASGRLEAASVDFVPAPDPAPALAATAGFATLLSAILFVLAKYSGSLAGFLYSRFGRDRVLDNTNREMVYEAVRNDPGLELARIAERTSLHRATVAYHVRVLARVGLLSTVRRGKAVHVLERGLLNSKDLPRILSARNEPVTVLTDVLGEEERPLKDVVIILPNAAGLRAEAPNWSPGARSATAR